MESSLFRLQRGDVLLALALVCAAQIHVWSGAAEGSRAVTAPAALAIAGAVAWRRRAPLAAVGVAMAAVVLQTLLASSPQALWFIATLLVLFYSAGAALRRERAAAALALGLVALTIDEARADDRSVQGFVFASVALIGLPWIAGRTVHRREGRAEASELRAAILERDREEATRAAVTEERARIARDLHDMVAHAVSVIVLKAEAADAVLDGDPARTREQLSSIQQLGRQALGEMTRLLGMLRDDAGPEIAPQPSTAQLASLIAEVEGAGVPVELTIEGSARPLAPGVDLTVYRIVQEALTNTLKHAGSPASARVVIRYDRDSVHVAVRDDGTARLAANGNGGGHGLIGMRERVALYSGTLHAGPLADGGFTVEAVLPVETESR